MNGSLNSESKKIPCIIIREEDLPYIICVVGKFGKMNIYFAMSKKDHFAIEKCDKTFWQKAEYFIDGKSSKKQNGTFSETLTIVP